MSIEGTFALVLSVIAAAESLSALMAYRDSKRRAAADAERSESLEDQREAERLRISQERRASDDSLALAIHQDLTGREVLELVSRIELSAVDRQFLAAVRDRAQLKSLSLGKNLRPDSEIQQMIDAALENLTVAAPPEDRMSQSLADAAGRKLSRDAAKYRWKGGEPISKWAMINRIAAEMVRKHGIETRAEFLAHFVPELRAAVGHELDVSLNEARVLIEEKDLSPSQAKQTADFARFDLDDATYLVSWTCGYPNSAVGTRVHKPLIERFASNRDNPFPISLV